MHLFVTGVVEHDEELEHEEPALTNQSLQKQARVLEGNHNLAQAEDPFEEKELDTYFVSHQK